MSDLAATTAAAETATTTAAQDPAPTTLLGSTAATTAGAATTALGAVQTTQTTTTTDNAPDSWLPEKFRVMDNDQLNFQASAQKLGEAYGALEKRFGAGDARPETYEGYKIEQGEGFNNDEFLAAPGVKEWMQQAHEMGFNNKQLNFMISEFVNAQPSTAEQVTGMSQAEAQAELQKTWSTPDTYNRNMLQADAAAKGLLKDDYLPFIHRYGNDPAIIKLLAAVGGEMGEDALRLAGQPMLTAESVEDLMRNPAYRDDKHPDHRRVTQQVREHFQRVAGNVIIN